MPIPAKDVRQLLRAKGWTNADLAAHWGHSINYVSWLVNNPYDRPRIYDDAFRGLPERSAVDVKREGRHHKKRPQPKWSVEQMYPIGRVFVTQNNRLGPEEGSEMAVVSVSRRGEKVVVVFEVVQGEAEGDTVEIVHGEGTDDLSDTGQDRSQRGMHYL